MNHISCADSVPTFLNYFDFSVAPSLLYYSYIPVIIALILLSVHILIKDKYSFKSKLLLSMALSFVVWVLNIIVQWTIVYADISMFSWQITALIEIFIPILVLYFIYVFSKEKDISERVRLGFFSVITTTALLTPTIYNISGFDVNYCEGLISFLPYSVQIFEILTIFLIGYIVYEKYHSKADEIEKRKVLYLSIGASIFLLTFSLSGILGQYLKIYSINLIGPIGMVLFLGLLTYLIVKFKAFNIKLLGAQALVYVLIILIGSQFFFIRNNINRILTGITELLAIVFGYYLILGVKKEVEHKEEIEKLASSLTRSNDQLTAANEKLKELDKQKTEFVSLASHQLRSPLTAIKGYSSMILEGSFGKINDKAKEAIGRVFESSQRLVLVIEDFLNITRIELGKIKYDVSEFSFNTLIKNVIGEQKPNVERRGLAISYKEDAPEYKVYADMGKISQVVSNLIDNSVKYCKEGSITVKLIGVTEKNQKKVRLSVTDTGIGIEPQVLPHLFQKFVRAYDAGKTNIIGTGLGLFVAKQMIDAHPDAKIWAESEGKGKGSTFFVELPLSTGVAPVMIIPPASVENSGEAKPSEPAIPQPVAGDLS